MSRWEKRVDGMVEAGLALAFGLALLDLLVELAGGSVSGPAGGSAIDLWLSTAVLVGLVGGLLLCRTHGVAAGSPASGRPGPSRETASAGQGVPGVAGSIGASVSDPGDTGTMPCTGSAGSAPDTGGGSHQVGIRERRRMLRVVGSTAEAELMKQTPLDNGGAIHVAIIMDGNGRWAQARALPRTAGHRAGAVAVRRVVEAAPTHGIGVLTLYAFSSDNWKRPDSEVQALLRLLERYLRTELSHCIEHGIRIEVPGRRDRLPLRVQHAIADAEQRTAAGRALRLRIAIDYSSRDAIVQAAAHAPHSREEFARHLDAGRAQPVPDVDLLIRSGGERRLSDFLLWESAYAELYFTDMAWPEFDGAALAAAIAEFGRRQRRFGALQSVAAGAVAS